MKKAFSLLLALALLLTLAPAAFAAEKDDALSGLPVHWLDYESVYWWSYAEGLLLYEQNGKTGFLRTDGTPLTEAIFDNVGWQVVDGGIPVRSDWEWGKIDAQTGELIVDFLYSTAQEVVAPVNTRIVGTEGGPYAVATLDGTLLTDYKYWGFAPFSYGLAAVWTADGWGYVDAAGAEVIPCQYVSGGVEDFGIDGYAWVNGPEGYNIIDRTGREVFDAPKGKILAERPWRAGHGLWGFYDDNGLVGFVKADSGEIVIEPQYRLGVSPKGMQVGGVFNEAGYASVLDAGGQEIAIDLTGQRVDAALAAPDGDIMAAHSGGLHPFMEDGKYGYMDVSEAVVVPAVFDYGSDFWDGTALVSANGVYGLLSDPRIPVFTDVAADAWYAPYVRFVAENGVMIGVGDRRFDPDATLSAQACRLLAARLYRLVRELPPEAEADWDGADIATSSRLEFASALAAAAGELEAVNDVETIPDTDDAAVLALYRAGILNGVDAEGHFAPDKTLTRAEAAAMVARVLEPALRLKA